MADPVCPRNPPIENGKICKSTLCEAPWNPGSDKFNKESIQDPVVNIFQKGKRLKNFRIKKKLKEIFRRKESIFRTI